MTLNNAKTKTLFLSFDLFNYPCLTIRLKRIYDRHLTYNFHYDSVSYHYNEQIKKVLI